MCREYDITHSEIRYTPDMKLKNICLVLESDQESFLVDINELPKSIPLSKAGKKKLNKIYELRGHR